MQSSVYFFKDLLNAQHHMAYFILFLLTKIIYYRTVCFTI